MALANGMCVSPLDVHADPTSESDAREGDLPEGYIALHFPDSIYYVNERSIILGRDVRLAEFLEKHTDLRVTTAHPSYDPAGRNEYPEEAMGKNADCSSGDEQSEDEEDFSSTEPRFASLEGGIATFDINLQQTIGPKNDVFLPIHPPGDPESGRFPRITAISKQHLRIYVSEEDDCWMLEVLGRNGAFVDDRHFGMGKHVPLDHMARIGVGGLDFTVAYGDVSDSELEDNQDSSSGEEEDVSSVEESETTPESMSPARYRKKIQASQTSDSSEDDEDEDEEENGVVETSKPSKSATKLKLKVSTKNPDKTSKDDKQPKTPGSGKPVKKLKETSEEAQKKIMSLLQPGEEPGRRKGPGRPPANGLMSKREMKERQKAMADAAKREKEGSTGEVKSPNVESAASGTKEDPDDKANNKKRKRSATTGDPKAENAERKKRQTPEKSPEPTEDQFTPEQLQPPGLTYVVIIYRILQDMSPQQLNLQQLYREMKKRYPYYRFRPKPGWESSVRHTVSAHNFIKGEKDGKGFKYTFNPDEPPAPQKQKQVTAPSHQPGFTGRPMPGQYGPGNYANPGYAYGNSYPQGPLQQGVYGQNLPLHNQRPLANSANQPGQYPQAPAQLGAARNPQNSPYPINPTVPGLAPGKQSVTAGTQPNGQTQTTSGITQQPLRSLGGPIPNVGQSNSQIQSQQSLSKPPLAQSQAPHQGQPSPAPGRINGTTPKSLTPAQANGPSKPPVSPISPQVSTANGQPQQSINSQQPSRPPSQAASTPTSASRPKTPFMPTASEELAAGKTPSALTSFEANMKRLASNMPQRQQDLEMRALESAMQWVRDNPSRDFVPEQAMDSYEISIITNIKTLIKKRDQEILASRA